MTRTNKRWQNHHPKAAEAHKTVQRAIRHGELKRQPCRVCGCARTHAHHEDYDRPLDVLWFCHAHHVEHHRQERLHGKGQALFPFFTEGEP